MDFLVPKLSATMETATVLRWLKQAGDKVRMGEPLVELETDKAAIEVEAPADGVLESIAAQEGAELPIGATLGRLSSTSGVPTAFTSAPAAAAPTAPSVSPSRPAAAPKSRIVAEEKSARVLASPLARRLAREAGLDLASVAGTGQRIRRREVVAALDQSPTSSSRGRALSPMRQRIAEAVALSRRTIPAFALDRWVESTALERARTELAPAVERGTGIKVTITDLLLQAMADTLVGQPGMLDRWIEGKDSTTRASPTAIDIGLVVAVEGGMMIPVLANLGKRSLAEIARARRDATQRARIGRLNAADSQPASISLSNLGKSGIDRFEAIINPGQTSILAVGREHERVIARGGTAVVARGFNLTLSVDHRLIDGVAGAAFLSALADRIEFGPWTAS